MIVKDEEHVIERCLESCYKLVDSYCIVDTGSTDRTKEIIKNFFDDKGIEGKIIDFPFTNFEECRNLTITEGRELGEYGFWIDADEVIELTQKFDKKLFSQSIKKNKLDQLTLTCEYDRLKYVRTQIYRFDKGYYWYGPVHEVLTLKPEDAANIKSDHFKYGAIIIKAEGNSWTGDVSEKYRKHAEILLKYQIDNNWQDPRWTFYLAQSYRDAFQTLSQEDKTSKKGKSYVDNCIKYYNERIVSKNRGNIEELYYSQLMICKYKQPNVDMANYILELLKCDNLNPFNRVEHLYYAGSVLVEAGYPGAAMNLAERGVNYLKVPTKAVLFLEHSIYEWKMLDLYSVSLARMGRIEEAVNAMKLALSRMKGLEGTADYVRIQQNIINNKPKNK